MYKLLLFPVILAVSTSLGACSAKVSSSGPDAIPAPPPENKVAGPNLTGSWSSGCQTTNFGEFKSLDVVFTTGTVSRKSTTYADARCGTVASTKTEAGTYKFLQANKDGSYTVGYAFPIGQGVTALPQEKVLLDNDVLYLSDYAIGDSITKAMMIPLSRVPNLPTGH